MDQHAIQLLVEECRCIPKRNKITLPPHITVPFSWEGYRFEQQFGLEKIVIPHESPLAQRVKQRIHLEFDAHKRTGEIWDCFLILYDVVQCAEGYDWRCIKIDGQQLRAKQIRWKMWENQLTIVGLDEILPMIRILLKRHFKKVGPDGFNAYLSRMTPSGETPQRMLIWEKTA